MFFLSLRLSGDKAEHREKRTEEKQKAVLLDMLVLETDLARRKRYLRLPKILALLVCPSVCIVSGFVLYLTKNSQNLFTVQLLRLPFMALMAAAVFFFILLLMYWTNCSGTSLVQRIYLTQDQLYYTGYSGVWILSAGILSLLWINRICGAVWMATFLLSFRS